MKSDVTFRADSLPNGVDVLLTERDIDGKVVRTVRIACKMSTTEFSSMLDVGGARVVRRWEDGSRPVPGPVKVVVRALATSPDVREYFGLPPKLDLDFSKLKPDKMLESQHG